nr:hypothetical protein [Candidatus Sigynarchaeota archaeon]
GLDPNILEVIATFIEPVLTHEKKKPRDNNRKDDLLKDAALAMSSNELQRASEIFHQLAIICFEQEQFDEGMDFIIRAEDAKTGIVAEPFEAGNHGKKRGYKEHLADLQGKAIIFFERAEYDKVKNILKQMVAMAEQIRDPILEANYKQNLRKVEHASKAATNKRK